jgi:hypothetical protein
MKKLLTAIILIASMNSYAQSFREVFTEANLLTEDGYYGLAIPLWESLLDTDPDNANINYKLGTCYLSLGIDRELALPYLIKASENVKRNYDPYISSYKGAPTETYYYLALSYHIKSNLEKAEEFYQKFLDQSSSKHFLKDDAERGIEELITARELMKNPLQATITNLGGPINTEFAEYSPIVAMDESTVYFTSRRLRPDSTNRGSIEATTGMYYEDMYVSYRNINGKWMNPELLNINIPGEHSSVVSMGKNGRKIYIYRIFNGKGNIYESNFILGSGWTNPVLVGSDVNSSHNEYFAALSADENRLYFVSDRPGGLGGKDIWYSNKLPNGQWGKALNLGAPINSAQDEDAPFIHPDGKTMFFSSNGHKTMGGYDIFFSKLIDEKWSDPTNMGYPINSTDNDHSFITTPSGKRGYYSSKGSGSLGSTDIYIVDFKPEEPNAPEVDMSAFAVLKGFIFDPSKQEIPDDLSINISKNSSNELVGSAHPVKRNGSYVFIIPSGDTYLVEYILSEKVLYSEVVAIPEGVKYQEIKREIFFYTDPALQKQVIALDEKVLGNVLKWKLRLFGNNNTATVGSRVLYLDGEGNVIDTVYVSKEGFFEYKKLSSESILRPILDLEDGSGMEISLMDEGKTILQMININGVYYEKGKEPKLAEQKIDLEQPSELKWKLKVIGSTNTVVVGARVFYLDEDGNLITSVTVVKDGYFDYKKLGAEAILKPDLILEDGAILEISLMDGDKIIKQMVNINGIHYEKGKEPQLAQNQAKPMNPVPLKWKLRILGSSNTITVGSRMLYLDADKNVIDTVYVSVEGYFDYKKLNSETILKPDFELKDSDRLEISLMDGDKVVMRMININGVYYEKGKEPQLAQKKAEPTEPAPLKWKVRILGSSNTITVGSRMLYLDADKNVIDTVYVSVEGYFDYKKLNSETILKPDFNIEDGLMLEISLMDGDKIVKQMINLNGVYYEKGKASEVASEPDIHKASDTPKKFLKTRAELKAEKTKSTQSQQHSHHRSSITIYLNFNQTEIPASEPDFTAAVSDLLYYMKQGKELSIEIIASASNLPTSQFANNQMLAEERLKLFELALNKALQGSGLDINKISTIKRKAIVSGPTYSQKGSNDRSDFIEFQYVRLNIN